MKSIMNGKIDVKKYINFSILLICSIVGVGFISGAEIYQFFARFKYFWLGTVLFGVLLFILSRKILIDTFIKKCNIMQNFGEINAKNTNLTKNKIKSSLIFIDVLMVASAMISGLSNLLEKIFNQNKVYIFLLFIIVVYIILCVGIKGIAKLDMIVLAIALFFSGFMMFDLFGGNIISIKIGGDSPVETNPSLWMPLVFSLLYVFMNIISIQPVTKEFQGSFTKKDINIICIIFSSILTILLSIFILFLNKNAFFSKFPMPFLEYFSMCDKWIYVLYVIGLFLALSASYLSCLVGVKRGLGLLHNNNFVISGISIVLTLLLGLIDFTVYVSIIYPLIGVLNIIIFMLM